MASEDRHLLRQRHLFSLSVNGRKKNYSNLGHSHSVGTFLWDDNGDVILSRFRRYYIFGLRPISCEEAGHPITLDDIHRKSDKHLSKPKASQYAMSMQRTLPSLFVEVFRRASISNTYLCQSVGRSVSS